MSTRSLTHIHDGDLSDPILCTIYRQSDGYPEGLGTELAEFISPIEVVNGISGYSKPQANGMGCLAAQLVKHMKETIGGVYIHKAGSKDSGEEYTYHIYCPKKSSDFPSGSLNLRVEEGAVKVFDAASSKFKRWLNKQQKENA